MNTTVELEGCGILDKCRPPENAASFQLWLEHQLGRIPKGQFDTAKVRFLLDENEEVRLIITYERPALDSHFSVMKKEYEKANGILETFMQDTLHVRYSLSASTGFWVDVENREIDRDLHYMIAFILANQKAARNLLPYYEMLKYEMGND